MSSASSSSQKDIEESFENHARKSIQSELYKVFKVPNKNILKGKELCESAIFKMISPFVGKRTDGEVDVYLGIISPSTWKVVDSSSNLHVIDGSFESCCKSLNDQEQRSFEKSPTTPELETFNYYSIFEVTHQQKVGPKLKQLEYQLQYIVARQFQRDEKDFPPTIVSSLSNEVEMKKAFREFIGPELLRVVCFAGLIMPHDFSSKETVISKTVNDGYDFPCLFSLLKNNRLMYLKSETLSQRLELYERKQDRIAKQVGLNFNIDDEIAEND